MSKFEQKDNSGALFLNDKAGNEARPDRSGDAMIDGVIYRMAGWINTSSNGNKYLSLKFTRKDEVHAAGVELVTQKLQAQKEMEDDVPF